MRHQLSYEHATAVSGGRATYGVALVPKVRVAARERADGALWAVWDVQAARERAHRPRLGQTKGKNKGESMGQDVWPKAGFKWENR